LDFPGKKKGEMKGEIGQQSAKTFDLQPNHGPKKRETRLKKPKRPRGSGRAEIATREKTPNPFSKTNNQRRDARTGEKNPKNCPLKGPSSPRLEKRKEARRGRKTAQRNSFTREEGKPARFEKG